MPPPGVACPLSLQRRIQESVLVWLGVRTKLLIEYHDHNSGRADPPSATNYIARCLLGPAN
jgi:hypothetical protein